MERSKINRKIRKSFVEVPVSGGAPTLHQGHTNDQKVADEENNDMFSFRNLENLEMALFFNRIQSQFGKK